MPAPVTVHLCKPARHREVSFTEKTGGGNDEAGVVERTLVDVPAREHRQAESNGWCRPHCKTNQSICMRKGSVAGPKFSRLRAEAQFERFAVRTCPRRSRERLLSSCETKGTRRVVLRDPKDCVATEAARHGRFIVYSSVVEHL